MADPDQDILDFYNQSHGSSGSPSATMTPDPDQDILDFYNKSRAPTPSPTSAPSRSPYTDQAVQAQSATLNPPEKPGIVSTIAGSAARGFLPGRAMLAAYPYGAVAGAAGVGALRGALVGAAVPIAGETGISEAIGGVIGGLIAGGIAAWGVHKLQTKAADVVSPEGAFSSKMEQAQVAAHPYAAIVGGGLSFGKPNPMNVVRAGKTLASKEGRAAMVAFTKTQGKGMDPQAVDEVGNVINVAMAGGLNSAFNISDQIQSGHFDPEQLAVAAATGLLFNQPWLHKPNPAAAAAAKTMAQFGMPSVGPSGPTAPPGIAAPGPPIPPGVAPPAVGTARPRVPGLLDFEIPPPVSETARAPEQPLPEAPIPRPGTDVPPEAVQPGEFGKEGYTAIPTEGGPSATQERPVTESRVEEHIGVPQRENVPAHPADEGAVSSEQAGYRGGVRAAETEPVAERPYYIQEDPLGFSVVDREANKIINVKSTRQEAEARIAELEAAREPAAAPEEIPEPEGELKTPYSIKKEGDLFVIKDSRDPTRVTSAPKRTLEEAQQRKAALDKTFEKNELARMQREHEAELLAEAEGHQKRGGDELLEAVQQHGVPLTDPVFSGELETLKGHFAPRGKYGQEKHRKLFTKERLNWGDIFQKDAGSLDSLTQLLKSKGFEMPDGRPVEFIDDTIQLIDERLRSGKKVYGNEARAQALEEESFGQGPMHMKHPFGGFFGKKEAEPFTPENSDLPGHEKSPDQLDKDLAIAAKAEERLPKTKNEPGRQIVATSQDKEQVERLLGENAYKSSITNVVIKELLQNGFDAVREGGASELKPGQIAIDYDYATRTITVRDNGVGMDPETIVNAFLKTGGTKKSGDFQNTSGGLGIAKLAFIKGSKRIKLVTVKDGLKTVMDVDQAQIRADQIPLDSSYTNEPNGTTVTVEIPKDYVNTKGETTDVWFDTDPEFLKNPLFGPVEVTVNGEKAPMGIHTEAWTKDNRFNFSWGHADVYIDPRPLQKYTYSEGTHNPKYSVMSAGLHQFDVSWGQIFDKAEDWIPHNIVIDVRSHVDTKHPQYPFDNQREGWRGTVNNDAKAMYGFLKKQGLEQRLKKTQEVFSRVKVLPKIPMGDLGKDLTQEQVTQNDIAQSEKGGVTLPKITSIDVQPDTVVTNYATGKTSVQSHEQFNKPTFSSERKIDFEQSKLDTSHLDSDAPLYNNNTNVKFEDIKGAPELHTKLGNMFVSFMREFGRLVSKEPNSPIKYQDLISTDPKKRWFGGISYDTEYSGLNIMYPFRSLWFNPGGVSEGALAAGPKRAAMETLHTFLHEITHVPQRNEGSGFTREETNNIGRLADFPHQKFVQALEQVYTKHWDTLNEINAKLSHPDTKNSAESFKAGSQLESESKRAKRSDEGVPPEHAPEDVGLQEQGPTGPGRAGESDRKIGSLGDILTGQKSGAQPGAEPAQPEVAAPATQPEAVAPAAPVPEGISGRGGVVKFSEGQYGNIRAEVGGKNPLYFKFDPVTGKPGAYKIDFVNLGKTRDPATAFPIFREHLPKVISEFIRQYAPKELYALSGSDVRARIYGRLIEDAGFKAESLNVLGQKGYKISIPGESVRGIRDTLAGIKEAAAQPPETPEQRQFAPPLEVQTGEHEVRPPTPSEAASPRKDMSEQEMSKTIENSLQRFHEEALTTSGTSSGGLSHNDIIDAGRNAIRHGVDPEAVAGSRAIPVDQKYTVTRAHGEDLRDMAEAAEDLARRNPSQVNKDAADAAFSDYSNWDKETVRPLRKQVEEQYPGIPPEDFNPRSMTDLRQQMIRQNNRDFTTRERVKAEAQLKEVERTTMARNKELMKWDEELRKGSPELIKDIKNGDELFEYVANVMKKLFPCS